jgi:outer membrane receptor protein involved in Fe transport
MKRWAVKIGMRLEATAVDVNFDLAAEQVRQRYLNFIPNIAAGRKLGKTGNLNVGFAQRIKRPGINKLNPFVDRSNPAFEVSGNPDLKPSLINNVLIGYGTNSKLAVNTGLNYSWVKSLFVQVSAFDAGRQITRTTYENTGKAQALDADLNLRYALSKVWNASVNLHGTYMLLEALNDGISLSNDWFFYNVSFNTGYNLNASWRVTASLDIKSRNMVNLQGTSNGYVASSFGINKDILKNKLSFSATINNAFTKYRDNFIETTGSNFLQTSFTQDYFRNYNVSLNYRFGKLKEGIKKSKRSINNDDLSN